MVFFKRHIEEEARFVARQFRAMAVIGPRQSGKSTFCRWLFKDKPHVNFERPVVQANAEDDPEDFLEQYPDGAILDEVQRVPDILRYLHGMLDENKQRGWFILTGSNNFLLQESVSQSLAGRTGYLHLLPLSYAELKAAGVAVEHPDRLILTGGYPEIWEQHLDVDTWMSSYVQTYVQRDVRLMRNITNLGDFNRFIMLCANHAGQLINREQMARSIGVDTKTIQAWLSVLESSYIIYLLQPWYHNLNKRIIKSPKLYFYDTGLLCHLLGIRSESVLRQHRFYGSIFENWVITEIKKNRFNRGMNDGMYFFRDSAGNEVDLLMEKEGSNVAVEIKSSDKINTPMFAGLKYWLRHNPQAGAGNLLIYGGEKTEPFSDRMTAMSWTQIEDL